MFKDIVLAITYQCNSRCQFCHIWQNKRTFSCQPLDYKKLPQNLRNVNISGGEPFLRDDLPKIVRVISQQCPQAKLIISTNGFTPCLIKEQIKKISAFKKNVGVAVSIDGFGKAHEELRGFPGGFSLALETIRLLKELGLRDLKIAFTLGDKNINQLKRVYRLAQELKVEFSLAVYHNSPHYFKKTDNRILNTKRISRELNWLIEQELKSFSPKKWLRAYFAWGLLESAIRGKRILPDYSGIDSLFIDPFGQIYPSDVWDLKLGQLSRIRNWAKFSLRIEKIISQEKNPTNWMICTVRQAMRRHWFRVGWWIIKKFLLLKAKRYDFWRHRIASGHGPRSTAGERAIRSSKIPRWGILR